MPFDLSPAQKTAFENLLLAQSQSAAMVLQADIGMGKSTVLAAAHARTGGSWIGMREFVEALRRANPLALEETFQEILLKAVESSSTVYVDDLHTLSRVCCYGGAYPRMELLNAPLDAAIKLAEAKGHKVVFVHEYAAPRPLAARAHFVNIPELKVADFEFFGSMFFPREKARHLEWSKIHKFAPRLTIHQIRQAGTRLAESSPLTTEVLIEYLRTNYMMSNVDLAEVAPVDLKTLKGVDDIIEALEANIILPFENDALTSELGVRAKRGVLLIGPPGTGKTTVGRALAHRLRSKFFLIDGTFISGSMSFYDQVTQIFETAKKNAPSIIFIDDSDVLFDAGKEQGLYRYLLTMLDGLESVSAGQVTVMMTAMDVNALPPALIRSGRIELWLETRLPDAKARRAIFKDHTSAAARAFTDIDFDRIAEATDGLTGADLKRVFEDGKILFAFDKARDKALKPVTEYFLKAIEGVRENKTRYAGVNPTVAPLPPQA